MSTFLLLDVEMVWLGFMTSGLQITSLQPLMVTRKKFVEWHGHQTEEDFLLLVGKQLIVYQSVVFKISYFLGSNDNLVQLWDPRNTAIPYATYNDHLAAVKAVSWCPWQPKTLATGGGTTDRTLKFWNTATGNLVQSVDTGSQVRLPKNNFLKLSTL